MPGTAPVVAFRGVSKTYPNGTVALRDVSFDVAPGTIHAICGENGAGKSTLMKILSGLEAPSAGSVVAPVGEIGMVHQHFSLIAALTVTENIILGQEPRRGPFIDRRAAQRRVAGLMARYDLAVNPDAVVGTLTVAAQQKVEILKALSRDVRLLILDEPTAVLSPSEVEELFHRLRALCDQGLTILFISHKLHEVRRLAGHVTVLRAGRLAGDAPMAGITDDAITRLAMGASVDIARRMAGATGGRVCLSVQGVGVAAPDPADRLGDISFDLRAGEILGVAGVDGNGQRGLVQVLTGRMRADAGRITLDGTDMTGAYTARWRQAGMAHLPADRFAQGGAAALTLAENAVAAPGDSAGLQRGPFLRRRRIAAHVARMAAEFDVRHTTIGQEFGTLSGGNAQKLIAARELAHRPVLLIADQPTRGIDIASAAFLHRRIGTAAAAGAAVLLISADLDEVLRLSDRVIVLFAGRIVADLPNGPDLTPGALGAWMLGPRAAGPRAEPLAQAS